MVGVRLAEAIDAFLLGLRKLPEVDVWSEHGEALVGEIVAEAFDR